MLIDIVQISMKTQHLYFVNFKSNMLGDGPKEKPSHCYFQKGTSKALP